MNIQSLFDNINSKVSVSNADLETVEGYFKSHAIKKNAEILSEGNYNNKLYFVEKGLLYSYKTLGNGNLQVIQFARENYWISDLYSFLSDSKSLFSVKAIEDTELWYIDKDNFEIVCKLLPIIETFFRLRLQTAYVNTLHRLSDVYSQEAREKYEKISQTQPDLLQRVPQYLLASYLGILPSSLSRIRNKG